MSSYRTVHQTRKNMVIYNTSDWHVGSLAFHEDAANELIQRIKDEGAYMTFGGDMVEGKLVDSPHFNPDGLHPRKLKAGDQARAFAELLQPIKDRVLLIQDGNHDQYMGKNFDLVQFVCEDLLGKPEIRGHYQSWLNVCGITMHFFHGSFSITSQAKDPIQGEANMKAKLKQKLYRLAGSAQVHYVGHTHHCIVVPPIEQYALLDSGDNVRGRYFTEKVRDVNGETWVPPDARWFVNTGTLRRSGGFGYQDYSEIAGYAPMPISCTKTTIEEGRIKSIEKVIL